MLPRQSAVDAAAAVSQPTPPLQQQSTTIPPPSAMALAMGNGSSLGIVAVQQQQHSVVELPDGQPEDNRELAMLTLV